MFSKSIILVATLASVSLLTSCANHLQSGVDAYNRGEYATAAQHLDGLAESGDRTAQYHVGLLWEQGLGSKPENSAEAARWYLRSAKQGYAPAMVRLANIQMTAGYEDQALSWYVLVARWGNDDAITALTDLGQSVPPADLLREQQRYEAAFAAQPAGAPARTVESACFSDSSCDVGFSCMKGKDRNQGYCRRSVADHASRVFGNASIDSIDSIKPNTDLDRSCRLSTDCPTGSVCEEKFCVAK